MKRGVDMKRSLLVQTLLDMATGGGGAKLEELNVNAAGTFDAGSGKGYNPVTVPSGTINVLGEKGVISNNSVVVTPKVQIVGGWVNSGETSGSGVGVTASELVSGSLSITSNGSYDVTNYETVVVSTPEPAFFLDIPNGPGGTTLLIENQNARYLTDSFRLLAIKANDSLSASGIFSLAATRTGETRGLYLNNGGIRPSYSVISLTVEILSETTIQITSPSSSSVFSSLLRYYCTVI